MCTLSLYTVRTFTWEQYSHCFLMKHIKSTNKRQESTLHTLS